MRQRRLVLVASTKPWLSERARLEIGDSLYWSDPGVEVVVDEEYPLVYVYSARLSPWEAFKRIVAEPPAYVERTVPVESLVKGLEEVVAAAKSLLRLKTRRPVEALGIEVHARGLWLLREGMEKREAARRYAGVLAEALGVRLSRKAELVLVVEDVRDGVALAVMRRGEDRISLWRARRIHGMRGQL